MKFSAPVPVRYRDVTDWYDEADLPADVRAWVEDHDRPDVGFSLLGPPGTGKTTTACWAATKVVPVSMGYVTSLKYQHALQARISIENMARSAPDDRADEVWDRHEQITGWLDWLRTECYLLVFDDWGKEHTTHTGFIEDEIEFLLRDRFDRGKATLLTSNMGLNSIKDRFGPSMVSFIHEAFPPVVLKGDDRRRS